ncbi:glycosyltransferase 87 family protein [Paracidobacterium acidisoli]|uniref:DUF2029 domain-containing protein n=1 Tax=Paracidobacterium acidisoli TaxID=2303751 RepID=A0A372ILK1_9BACT|nr:glycosyltransferase 87 family protein [Paracidobacterium acidisoli]MBT9332359.1 DUF2029 domain-containing protein [Paracidobacterium acidisoli]
MASSSEEIRATSRFASVAQFGPALENSIIAVSVIILLWKGVIAGFRSINTDFPNYYVVARLIREHYLLDRIYDWVWFQRATDHFGITHQLTGYVGLTPFSAFPLLPFAELSPMHAKYLWVACNIVLLVLSVCALGKISGMGSRRAWFIALCALVPLRNDLLYGQMHLVILALLAAGYIFHMRGKQVASGCCMAIAGALKIYPLFFCLYFLLKRRWKALTATILCAAACIALSYVVAGQSAMHAYLTEQLPRSLRGESTDPFLPTVTSATAMFHRLFLFEPELNPHPFLQSPLLYAMLYPLWQAILAGVLLSLFRPAFNTDAREALEWASFTTLLLFLSSAPATYHYVVLILPAVITLAALLAIGKKRAAVVFFLLYLAACNLTTIRTAHNVVNIFTPLHYVKLWAGVGLICCYCIFLLSEDIPEPTGKKYPFVPVRTATFVLGLWLAGAIIPLSHLRHFRQDVASRIALSDSAYVRSAPIQTDRGLMYVAMLRSGYHIMLSGKQLPGGTGERQPVEDQLSFTTDVSGKEVWIEEAGSSISRVVRMGPSGVTCEIENAESPALSRDGRKVAFLREDHGHGSLWLFDAVSCEKTGSVDPVKLTSAGMDVRTVVSASGDEWIFSALAGGRERIYAIVPGHAAHPLIEEQSDLDSPSPDPEGGRIVARKRIGEHWQLIVINPAAAAQTFLEKQLTSGDCDAYTPSWEGENTILYATDCSRGRGMNALATLKVYR